MAIGNYPLSWPEDWKRTLASERKHAQFGKVITDYRYNTSGSKQKKGLSISDGIARILDALEAMGVDRQDTIISTNVRTRLDGLPRSGEREPDDPGAAVYWREHRDGRDGPMKTMAIDRYSTVADNLAAIGATLDAMRAIERHGGAAILDRAFTGFAALPASTEAEPDWWSVLGVPRSATAEQIEAAYRMLARQYHPDVPGGSHELMQRLNAARKSALAEKGGA